MALFVCFESRRMIVVLLLCACISLGLSYDELEYGETYRIRLPRKTQSIEFSPSYSSDVKILWNRYDPQASKDSRQKLVGSYFNIAHVTQKDQGNYIMKDKDQKLLSTRSLEVRARQESISRNPGEYFSFDVDLEPNYCNIYFFSNGQIQTEIVREGRLRDRFGEHDCVGFEFVGPCGISNDDLQMSCKGHFEFRDQNDDMALMLFLEMEPLPSVVDTAFIGIGVGVFFGILSCCCCVRRCCCQKSSSEKDGSESPDAEPAAHYHEYDHEPVGPRRDQLCQPSETLYPALPSYAPTGPLIHNSPTVNVPPAYSEVSAPVETSDAPAFPLSSDPEPRFELSFASALPLSSNSAYSDVYTSDKLNFC